MRNAHETADHVQLLRTVLADLGEHEGLDAPAVDRVFTTTIGALEREGQAVRERRLRWRLVHGRGTP